MINPFHNYCRSEKFFSATLLSYLFINNNFHGLKKFLLFLQNQNGLHIEDLTETDIKRVHYATEMNLLQDFAFYRKSIHPNSLSRKSHKESIPDIVTVINNIIIIIEAKYYSNFSENSLSQQLSNQKYVFDLIKDFYSNPYMTEIHICLCPEKIHISNGIVITWKEIYNLFKGTPNCEYVLDCLYKNLECLKY